MKLYDGGRAPNPRRVRIFLAEKGIEIEKQQVDIGALEHKEPLAPGNLPDHCELVGGEFWTGDIARHDRLRLAYAVWSVLSQKLL